MEKITEIRLVDPDESQTKDELCLHNLKESDDHYQLYLFIAASFGWFELYPDKNYQDFEVFLRNNGMNTHLIAVKPAPDATNLYLISGDPAEFECIFSCRPKELALKELMTHSSNYEENFGKLLRAGTLKITSKDEKIKNLELLSEEEINDSFLLKYLKKKIMIKEILISDYIEMVRSKFKGANEEIIGFIKNIPVFGFIENNKLITDIGYFKQGDKFYGVAI